MSKKEKFSINDLDLLGSDKKKIRDWLKKNNKKNARYFLKMVYDFTHGIVSPIKKDWEQFSGYGQTNLNSLFDRMVGQNLMFRVIKSRTRYLYKISNITDENLIRKAGKDYGLSKTKTEDLIERVRDRKGKKI